MMNKQEASLVVSHIQAYIQANLQKPITASDIAKAAGYSQYHASRLFKEETGLSPFEYIRQERLVNAARTLRRDAESGNKTEPPKVLDVALDYVFDSHEGFTRAFANAFGITPKKYTSYPSPKGWQIPFHFLDRQKLRKLELEELKMKEKTAIVFVQIMERPARKLILRRSKNASDYFEYCDEFDCPEESPDAPWSILCNIKEALHEPVGLWLPENMRPAGTGIYAQGVEVPANYTGEIPKDFDVIDLAPCKLMVFQGEPYDDEQFGKAVGACMERIKEFNPEVYGYKYAYDIAPKMQFAPMGWRGYIEMHPVAAI